MSRRKPGKARPRPPRPTKRAPEPAPLVVALCPECGSKDTRAGEEEDQVECASCGHAWFTAGCPQCGGTDAENGLCLYHDEPILNAEPTDPEAD